MGSEMCIRDSNKVDLLTKMRDEQKKIVNSAWNTRAPGLPLKNTLELLILASIVEKEAGNENDKKNRSNKFHVNEFLGGRIYKRSRENNRIKKTGYKSIIGQLNKLYKVYFIYGCYHLFTQLKVVQNVTPFAPTMLIILANK